MEKIKIGVVIELKSLRIYWLQLFVVLFLLPFSYLFIMFLSSGGNINKNEVVSLLIGYMVVTLVSSFVNMLSLRITNTKQPEVLELYSTYSMTFPQIIVSQCITYTLLTLPLVIVVSLYAIISLQSVNVPLFITGTIIGISVLLLISIFLGLAMNNLFLANGLFQILFVIFVILSPSYFNMQSLNKVLKILLIFNPITHMLNILRTPLKISSGFDIKWSYLYLFVLSILLVMFIARRIKNTYVLEKIF
ncbi:MAG: hypothetical protein ACPLPP_07140 [Caldisericum exile]|jgi:ABC-2 type transport system permease protein